MDLGQALTAGGAIVGLVNGIRLLKEASTTKNYWGFILFVSALVAGSLFGYFHWFMLPSLEAGFAAGLLSSGAYRALEINGGIKQ